MIQFTKVHLSRGTQPLLEKADLLIQRQRKVGIVGPNGCGKSSLFAVIQGNLQPNQGEFSLPGQVRIAHLAQETPALHQPAIEYVIDGDRKLREVESLLQQAEKKNDSMAIANLHERFADLDGYTAHSRAGELLFGLGFGAHEHSQNVAAFSGGWRMRLNLAQALMCPSDLLLLDEPTNHLDLDAIIWLEQWLRSYQGTLLLISHDRDFLDGVVNTIVQFDQKRMTLYNGNYTAFERMRAAQLQSQQAFYEKQQRARQHLQSFVDRFRAKASKAKQAQSRIKALEKMDLVSAVETPPSFNFNFKKTSKAPNPLLNLEHVSIGYNKHPILEDINLAIRPDHRLGLLGPNGAGKSTLIKLLAGELIPLSGVKTLASGVKVGYFAQHQLEQLHPEQSPLQHLQILDPKASIQELRSFLGSFNFHGDKAINPIAPLSGGEKARVVLALLVWQCPHLLLLDEPTNHLDINMREALATALQDYTGTMIIVSHDRHLLRLTCDEFFLVAEKEVKPFTGDLEDYVTWLTNYKREQGKNKNISQKTDSNKSKEDKKNHEKRINQLEKDIDKLNVELKKINACLENPELYTTSNTSNKAMEYQKKRKVVLEKLEVAEEEWMSLQA